MNHVEFLAKERRVYAQEDGQLMSDRSDIESWNKPHANLAKWLDNILSRYEGTPVDVITWDIGMEPTTARIYTRGETAPFDTAKVPILKTWQDKGLDALDECIKEAKKRGIESFWCYRVSEVDLPPVTEEYNKNVALWTSPLRHNGLKEQHPDWLVQCWWPQGHWNLANAELRQRQVNVISELLRNYDLDGLEIDFTRHTPFLPPGREEELHSCVTAFLSDIRKEIQKIEREKKRPILLAVKIAENPAGCRLDGMAVEEWMHDGLVDILFLGGRTAAIDFTGFRALPGAEHVKLVPMLDGHHTDAGAHRPDAELLRGIFSNWLVRGADSIGVFNWTYGNYWYLGGLFDANMPSLNVLRELNNPETMMKRPKKYRIDSRGEYPWAGNYTYRNDDKPLPATVAHGAGVILPVEIWTEEPGITKLELLIENLREGDLMEAQLNGMALRRLEYVSAKNDPHRGFQPEEAEKTFPGQSFAVPAGAVKVGANLITLQFRANVHPVLFTVMMAELS